MSFLLIYCITLIILLIILILLWSEERRFKKRITHGLANRFWILRERRRFVRFNEGIRIRYNIPRKPSNVRYSQTSNISRKGLSLVTYEKLKEKTYLDLELELSDFSKPIKVLGQVVWSKDLRNYDKQGRRLFDVGIRFTKINPESEAMLLAHLNNLRRK